MREDFFKIGHHCILPHHLPASSCVRCLCIASSFWTVTDRSRDNIRYLWILQQYRHSPHKHPTHSKINEGCETSSKYKKKAETRLPSLMLDIFGVGKVFLTPKVRFGKERWVCEMIREFWFCGIRSWVPGWSWMIDGTGDSAGLAWCPCTFVGLGLQCLHGLELRRSALGRDGLTGTRWVEWRRMQHGLFSLEWQLMLI